MTALRTMARLAVVVGAIGSVALMLYIGRRNQHYWLLVMFVVWDAAPFLALGFLDFNAAARWSAATRAALYIVTLIVTVVSLGAYVDVVVRPRPQPAALFLIMPVVAWLLMATAVPMTEYLSRKQSPRR
jgi:hypothetical protein